MTRWYEPVCNLLTRTVFLSILLVFCAVATGFYSSYSLCVPSLSSGMVAGRTGCPVSPGSLAL